MASQDSTDKVPNFLEAMALIYGPLPSSTDPHLDAWTPPPAAEGHRGRYLWTDGFAVVNFLTLYNLTHETPYLTFARNLITAVHNILGYTRDGTSRLPGATDDAPLKGGLRIGKHDESGPDGDGQYFHYLTVWMFALNRFTFVTGEKWYNEQAISMAAAVLPKFMTNRDAARPRMFWKLSTDLSSRLVLSEGNLDPIDGYVTYKLLQATHSAESEVLKEEIALLKKIVDTKVDSYDSTDTLDLGMTLWTAHWLVPEEEWAVQLSRRALACLKRLTESRHFEGSTKRRLAFREFGTALGVRSVVRGKSDGGGLCREDELVDAEIRNLPDQICRQWEDAGLVPTPTEQMQGRMAELMPITAVMYASALIPGLMVRQS
ncbi:hypothetical protein G647_04867 [Cladophialophora carrionii CBS 160.54]|uniref:Uncharacterized protein n=1 Tax=Cladophialophora carrionii CBS 160.54 TaxID=1279043 RepID=V9D8S9_9EURO|nr:uncharacterized protein G647_04867 [Cladophialophora carrionii CBS 160.54]ETI23071.1 hypothetical protein G647_04867 [Cladophialophora carrionii CBS 160.54]